MAGQDVAAAYSEFFVAGEPGNRDALTDFLEAHGVDVEALWDIAEGHVILGAPVACDFYVRDDDEAKVAWLLHNSGVWAMGLMVGLRLAARLSHEEAT